MNDISVMAAKVKHHLEMQGRKIDAFLVPAAKLETPGIVELAGIPVEVHPSLMACVHRSILLNEEGKLGWTLNPNPFDGMVFEAADGGDG